MQTNELTQTVVTLFFQLHNLTLSRTKDTVSKREMDRNQLLLDILRNMINVVQNQDSESVLSHIRTLLEVIENRDYSSTANRVKWSAILKKIKSKTKFLTFLLETIICLEQFI